jgi:hypothetical protein
MRLILSFAIIVACLSLGAFLCATSRLDHPEMSAVVIGQIGNGPNCTAPQCIILHYTTPDRVYMQCSIPIYTMDDRYEAYQRTIVYGHRVINGHRICSFRESTNNDIQQYFGYVLLLIGLLAGACFADHYLY